MQHLSRIGLSMLLVTLGSGSTLAAPVDEAATLLRDRGLIKAGTTYVIEAEKPVLARIKDIKAAVARLDAIADRQAMEEQATNQLAHLEESRLALQNHLNELNQSILEQATSTASNFPRQGGNNQGQRPMNNPMVLERDQIKLTLAEVVEQQRALKANQPPPTRDKKALDEEIKSKAEAIRTGLVELRPMVDEVNKKYAKLKTDESINKAMDDMKKETKANFKLGPSDAFVAASKTLDLLERKTLGKKPSPVTRKKAKARK